MKLIYNSTRSLQLILNKEEADLINPLGFLIVRPQLAEKKLVFIHDPSGPPNEPRLYNYYFPNVDLGGMPPFKCLHVDYKLSTSFKGFIVDFPDAPSIPASDPVPILRELSQLIKQHGYEPQIENGEVVLYQRLRIAA